MTNEKEVSCFLSVPRQADCSSSVTLTSLRWRREKTRTWANKSAQPASVVAVRCRSIVVEEDLQQPLILGLRALLLPS